MKFRKLRIAWSVVWVVAAVLLAVLCVRSYRWYDFVKAPLGQARTACVHSWHGVLNLYSGEESDADYVEKHGRWQWAHEDYPRPVRYESWKLEMPQQAVRAIDVHVPHWFLLSLATVLGTTPWLRDINWRFSLRTLLIATTLVAVGLGMIVWMSRAD